MLLHYVGAMRSNEAPKRSVSEKGPRIVLAGAGSNNTAPNRPLIVVGIATFSALAILLVVTFTGNDYAVLYPDLNSMTPSAWFAVIGWLSTVLMIAWNSRSLGMQAVRYTLLYALIAFPAFVVGSTELSERIIACKLFSHDKLHFYYKDNFRIYRWYESKNRVNTSYYVKIFPYGSWANFKVTDSDYRAIVDAHRDGYDYRFCLSAPVEQVGMALRIRSPQHRLDPNRKIVKCPTNGLRSEERHISGPETSP